MPAVRGDHSMDRIPGRPYAIPGGLNVAELSVPQMLAYCEQRLDRGDAVHVATINPEIVMLARANKPYREALRRADIASIDGIGIALALLRQHRTWARRLTGVQITDAVLGWASRLGREVMIIGASDDSRRSAEARLRHFGIRVREGASPRVAANGEGASQPPPFPHGGVVFVALGAPKQELWIRDQLDNGAPPNVYIGVGGAIDYLSGAAAQPPAWMSAVGLEWVFRLIREPRQRFRRQLTTLPSFLVRHILIGR